MDVQRTGRIFGWLFIGTFVTSIPARLLFVSGLDASWAWELSLGIYCAWKGFRLESPLARREAAISGEGGR